MTPGKVYGTSNSENEILGYSFFENAHAYSKKSTKIWNWYKMADFQSNIKG